MDTHNSQEMTPEQAKASMGIATMLQGQLLPQGQLQQDASQTPNPDQGVPTNQSTPEDTKAQMDGLESRLMDELEILRAEMKTQGDGQKELSDLKKQIEAVLNSND